VAAWRFVHVHNAYVGLNSNCNQSPLSNSIIDISSARHDYAYSGNRTCLILRDDFCTFSVTRDRFQLSSILRLKCLFVLNSLNLCASLLFIFFIHQLFFFIFQFIDCFLSFSLYLLFIVFCPFYLYSLRSLHLIFLWLEWGRRICLREALQNADFFVGPYYFGEKIDEHGIGRTYRRT